MASYNDFSNDAYTILKKATMASRKFYHTFCGTPHIFLSMFSFLKEANMKQDERYTPVWTFMKTEFDQYGINGASFKECFLKYFAEGVEPAAQIAETALFAPGILGKHQVVAFRHLVDQLEALIGRGLAVVIQADDDVARHMVEAGHQRAVLAEVAAQIHKADGRILAAQGTNDLRGVVRAAVVDQHDLVIILISAGGNRFRQFLHHRADGLGGTVAGDDKGKKLFGHKAPRFSIKQIDGG